MTIKNFLVPSTQFPLIYSDGTYHVRYKIVTENNLISSDWSDIYSVSIHSVSGASSTASLVLGSQNLTLNLSPTYDNVGMLIKWDAVQNPSFSNIKYDVFVKWSYNESGSTYDTNWEHKGEYSSAECYITVPTGPQAYYLKARIQIATYDKVIADNVKLIESTDGVSTIYVASTGNIDGGVV